MERGAGGQDRFTGDRALCIHGAKVTQQAHESGLDLDIWGQTRRCPARGPD